MKTIIFHPFFYKGVDQIGIVFDNNQQLDQFVRKIKEVKWSQTKKCWYISLNKESCRSAYFDLSSYARIDLTELKQYLERRKQVSATFPNRHPKFRNKLGQLLHGICATAI